MTDKAMQCTPNTGQLSGLGFDLLGLSLQLPTISVSICLNYFYLPYGKIDALVSAYAAWHEMVPIYLER